MIERIAKYADLKLISVKDISELFTLVNYFDKTIRYGAEYSKNTTNTSDYINGCIVVRKTVALLLSRANKHLKKINTDLTLYVSYGYRSLEIQTSKFNKEFNRCTIRNENARRELVHIKIASPDVAGHPTGDAIDITIYNERTNKFLDMGCLISDFEYNNYSTHSKKITRKQQKNRLLLRDSMLSQNFSPYYE